jgi:hypothetical protein
MTHLDSLSLRHVFEFIDPMDITSLLQVNRGFRELCEQTLRVYWLYVLVRQAWGREMFALSGPVSPIAVYYKVCDVMKRGLVPSVGYTIYFSTDGTNVLSMFITMPPDDDMLLFRPKPSAQMDK